MRLKLVRAYAYGWGVPEDREQAVKHFQVLVSEGEFRDAAGLFSPYRNVGAPAGRRVVEARTSIVQFHVDIALEIHRAEMNSDVDLG